MAAPTAATAARARDIIFEAVAGLNTLIDFRYTQHFRAPRGKGGSGSNRTGAGGKDLVIKVPIGTQILADDEDRTLLADLTEEGQRIIFLAAAWAGAATPATRPRPTAPRASTRPALPGEEMWVWLRLKLLADVGLVGLPNAGKSTFLNSVTNAQAKVGDYPFTTLHPQLGVVRHKGREFVVADIPGLIEGAAEGAGIGDRFLGHVERTRVLLHLVDAAGRKSGRGLSRSSAASSTLMAPGLEDKTEIVALTKVRPGRRQGAGEGRQGARQGLGRAGLPDLGAARRRASSRCSTRSSSGSATPAAKRANDARADKRLVAAMRASP